MSSTIKVPLILPTEEDVEREATRSRTWPLSIWKIAPCENSKFACMSIMFGLIAFLYSVLRVTKDAVVSERQLPASILFLKTFFVTPFSIVCVFLLQVALQKTRIGNVLKYTVLSFGIYFFIYGAVLLNMQEWLEPNKFGSSNVFGDGKMAVRGLEHVLAFVLTLNFWTSSLLYVTSELWGNLILSLLFMCFSNDVCTFKQSLRFVPLFYIFSNVGLFFSGLLMYFLSDIFETGAYSKKEALYKWMFCISGIISIIIVLVQIYLEKKILPYPIYIVDEKQKGVKKTKKKMGLLEGLAYMAKSKLLMQMSFIVLFYNICTNLVDSVFKPAMTAKAKYHNLEVQSAVMKTESQNQMSIAILVIILLSTPFAQLVQKLGWIVAGLITPTWAICSCVLINGIAIYNTGVAKTNAIGFFNKFFGNYATEYVDLEVFIGQIATSGLKIAKYAAFDIAKEALSMRINKEQRATAKSIYDGICGKMGKTFGSGICMLVNSISGSVDVRSGSFYLFFCIAVMCLMWVYSVIYLSQKYNESIAKQKDIDLDIIDLTTKK